MRSIKQNNIENRPYYFSVGMINIKYFDRNLLNIDKISFESTDTVIYKIRYIAMKSIDNENPRLIFDNVDGYIKESNGDKYLIFEILDF